MSISIEDKLAIHELLGRAALGYDEREVDMLAGCFGQKAEFSMRIAGGDLVGPFVGRDEIMGLMTGSMATQTDVRRHVISNIVFTSSNTDAVEVVSNLTLLATENGNIELLSAGIYRDKVTLSDGEWRISHRHLDLDKAY
jgi:3-phenylpropionate/cinnamic acid dioxygenase small subunit